jgi:hypothetical protein
MIKKRIECSTKKLILNRQVEIKLLQIEIRHCLYIIKKMSRIQRALTLKEVALIKEKYFR